MIEKETEKIPVMAFKNKSKENRYLAAGMDHGDWEDADLDVKLEDIENAYIIWTEKLTPPTEETFEAIKKNWMNYKKTMQERFGEDVFISLDFEEVIKQYEPVNLFITKEQFDIARELE